MPPKGKNVPRSKKQKQVQTKSAGSRKQKRAERDTSDDSSDSEEIPEIALAFTRDSHRQNYHRLAHKGVYSCFYVDQETCEKLGFYDELQGYLGVGSWTRFFAIREPAFNGLTLEFLSTFSLNRKKNPNIVSFQIRGQKYDLTVGEFGVHLGIFDRAYIDTEEYNALKGSIYSNNNLSMFFKDIHTTNRRWVASRIKGSGLRTPVLRYLHALIARTINARTDSVGVITKADLIALYSMVRGCPINVAQFFANRCELQSKDFGSGKMGVGPYVTRLTRNLVREAFSEKDPDATNMRPLDARTLVRMKLVVARDVNGEPYYSFVNPEHGPVDEDVDEEENLGAEDESVPLQQGESSHAGIGTEIGDLCYAFDEFRANTETEIGRLNRAFEDFREDVGGELRVMREDITGIRQEQTEIKSIMSKILEKLCMKPRDDASN